MFLYKVGINENSSNLSYRSNTALEIFVPDITLKDILGIMQTYPYQMWGH